jgi:hypothetical protein
VSGLWQWNATDGTVRIRGNTGFCLQTASKVLDANVFVGECSSPLADQQKWDNIVTPTSMGDASSPCHMISGDYCSGCKDLACCDLYYVPGKGNSKYNCAWSNTSTCSQSPTPCSGKPREIAYAGLCVRVDLYGNGACLLVDSTGVWTMGSSSGNVSADPTTSWTQLKIIASGNNLTAVVNGVAYPAFLTANEKGVQSAQGSGMVSINSGFNVAYFDNFSMEAL